ncbi:MAG: helix-turn-helix transcriptional regulator [Acidobacteria bacterium]|nr:MAG: helix-turn-helix transcriptional regulator [Acidobacteriota bacterium]
MRTSPALVAIDTAPETAPPQVDEVIRTLVGLIEKVSSEMAQGPYSCNAAAEEVLVDTEVDGARYLLVRMPRPSRNRIQLSPREQEIVRMVAKGHPNKVIADVLNISSWTVCTHLRRIFAKLGVGSRAAMVAQLLEIGALTTDHRVTADMTSHVR